MQGWMLLAASASVVRMRAQGLGRPAAAAGRYFGESVCIYGGERMPMDEAYSGELSELREDGRGTSALGGDEAEFRWQLDGTALTLTSAARPAAERWKNGRIGDGPVRRGHPPEFRQSAAPAQEPAQPEEAGPAAEESPEPDAISWPGDWYGWYAIVDAGSDYDEFKRTAPGPPRPHHADGGRQGASEVWGYRDGRGRAHRKMKIRFAKGEGPVRQSGAEKPWEVLGTKRCRKTAGAATRHGRTCGISRR